jgi:L,D-peptidoglycan transpeptidase YkuD (ErfK/YbiS/YcfS/YnhG family)
MGAFEKARTARAKQLAPEDFAVAEKCLVAGQAAMTNISESWWPFHSYRAVDSLFEQSIRSSELAVNRAQKKRTDKKTEVGREVRILTDSVASWRDILDDSLPQMENEVLYREAIIKLRTADDYLRRGQTEAAAEAVERVRIIAGNLHRRHHWSEQKSESDTDAADWIQRTIAESKQKSCSAIIVDKSKHTLYLLKSGRVVDTVPCELGYNSGIQKKMAGDGATPEGMYRVTRVNNGSKYYRALLLNYPNTEDKKRFEKNRKSGVIPTNAKIGSLIELHGHGEKGRDWTDGCVAVENKEMDKLIKSAPVGTMVTIVRKWNRGK